METVHKTLLLLVELRDLEAWAIELRYTVILHHRGQPLRAAFTGAPEMNGRKKHPGRVGLGRSCQGGRPAASGCISEAHAIVAAFTKHGLCCTSSGGRHGAAAWGHQGQSAWTRHLWDMSPKVRRATY